MTREEERKTAIGRAKCSGCFFADIIKESIKWADKNPKSPWISVEDDLPCNHKELLLDETYTKDVLVVVRDSFEPSRRYITMMNMHNKIGPAIFTKYHWKSELGCRVTHWMPIPELPKE